MKERLQEAIDSLYLSKYQDNIIEQLDTQLRGLSKEKNLALRSKRSERFD